MNVYINDFVEDLNYKKIILYIGTVDHEKLRAELEKNDVNHLYQFGKCVEDKYMYIENCDLQNLDYYLEDYLDEGYSVFPLYSVGARYYIQMPCHNINIAL